MVDRTGLNRKLELTVGLLWGLLSALAVIFGSFGPWATFGALQVSGLGDLDGDGIVTLVMGVIGLASVLLARPVGIVLSAAVAGFIAAYDLARFLGITETFFGVGVNPGWGLLLVAAGALSLASCGVQLLFAGDRQRMAVILGAVAVLALAGGAIAGTQTGFEDQPEDAEKAAIQTTPEEEGPSAEDAKRWRSTWCNVDLEAQREQVRGRMGEPTSSDQDSDTWDGYGLSLTATYDPDLRASQLTTLSGDLPCEDFRDTADSTTADEPATEADTDTGSTEDSAASNREALDEELEACDANISVRPGVTTCSFANNTFYEYFVSGESSSLEVWSPAAGRRFDMECSSDGDTVDCTAPEGARVVFPQSAVDAYSDSQAESYAANNEVGP